MVGVAQYRGTTDFWRAMTADELKNMRERERSKVPCPRCGAPMMQDARTCWDCAMELRGKLNAVRRFMEPVVGLEAQMQRFREKVAREVAWMAEARAEFERRKGDE